MALPPGLPGHGWWLTLGLAWAIVFAAGVVRGFAGFGFSAICVAGLTLLVPPALVVPPIFALEVLASISLLRGAWPHADWRWLSWLAVGNLVFIPLGVALLAWLPETPLRVLIGLMLLAAAAAARSGFAFALEPTAPVRLATGCVVGLFNGLAAIGGTALAVMLSTGRMSPAAMRATMILLFLFTDLYALVVASLLPERGGVDLPFAGTAALHWAAWLAPAMLVGIWVGQRCFVGISPEVFRRRVLDFIIVVAVLGLLRAALPAWRGL